MSVRVIHGDCRQVLRALDDESVHCVVTSPPYFGLRDYGTGKWDGGDAGCDHMGNPLASLKSTLSNGRGVNEDSKIRQAGIPFSKICAKCGARRTDSQIGLEPTPEAYVAELVAVFREVKRVLRGDGICFLNLGDSYSSKQLLGIPWKVAFAIQKDGWILRSEIIWSKPNPMPESVTDRCTKAHEQVFMLSKNERYYFDADAIAEGQLTRKTATYYGTSGQAAWNSASGGHRDKSGSYGDGETRNKRSVWAVATQPYANAHFATFPPALIEPMILAGCPKGGTVLDPFGGAGTTGLVADRLGRSAILIELNPAYCDLQRDRIADDAPLFAEITT